MSIAIKVENLSKSYIIKHKGELVNDSLSGVITDKIKGKLLHTLKVDTTDKYKNETNSRNGGFVVGLFYDFCSKFTRYH